VRYALSLARERHPVVPADRGRQVALCPMLADAQEIAAELFAGDELALDAFDALGRSPEGELTGPWGEFRFAPAC
jgi:hypothetical protein